VALYAPNLCYLFVTHVIESRLVLLPEACLESESTLTQTMMYWFQSIQCWEICPYAGVTLRSIAEPSLSMTENQ